MTMRHIIARTPVLALAIVAMALVGFGSAADEPAAKTVEIKIDNFAFVPEVLTISTGTTVTWLNADDVPHVVRTEDKTIKSPPLDTDDTFSYTFEKKGTFPYFCSLHPKMIGKVVVQ
jgi:plastocyanin